MRGFLEHDNNRFSASFLMISIQEYPKVLADANIYVKANRASTDYPPVVMDSQHFLFADNQVYQLMSFC
jgi:hypothetical protein